MREGRMDLLWRILAAFSFDCFKDSSSSRSPAKLSWSPAGSLDSSSLTGSLSLGSDPPHCQSCISHDARLKRLSCGHLYCDSCRRHIVNLAFQDIEGLCHYPCPLCKALRQLGGPGGLGLSSLRVQDLGGLGGLGLSSPGGQDLGGPGGLGLSSLGRPSLLGGPGPSCSLWG